MSDNEPENGEEEIDEAGRNPTQQRIDEEHGGGEDRPVDKEWKPLREEREMSEVIPEDEDRDDDGAIGGALTEDDEETAEEEEQ